MKRTAGRETTAKSTMQANDAPADSVRLVSFTMCVSAQIMKLASGKNNAKPISHERQETARTVCKALSTWAPERIATADNRRRATSMAVSVLNLAANFISRNSQY